MDYYQVTEPRGGTSVSVWDPQAHRMFSWIANTECWHRDAARDRDFWFDRDLQWTKVDAVRAGELVADTERVDERSLGWVIDELRAQPDSERRTSAELGIPVTGRRVLAEELVVRRLATAHEGEWVDIAVYAPGAPAPPLALASDLRRGQRASLANLGPLDADVVRHDDGWTTVRARRAS